MNCISHYAEILRRNQASSKSDGMTRLQRLSNALIPDKAIFDHYKYKATGIIMNGM